MRVHPEALVVAPSAVRRVGVVVALLTLLAILASTVGTTPSDAQSVPAAPSVAGPQAELSDTALAEGHIDALRSARTLLGGLSTNRVVNGRESDPYEFPSVAGIVWADKTDFEGMRCGGAAITNEWILTAGHCLVLGVSDPVAQFEVLVGAWYLPLELGARHAICEVHIHPDYTADLANDIALVRVCGQHYQPTAAIPVRSQFDTAGSIADIVGWGLTESAPAITGELRTARLEIKRSIACTAEVGVELPNPVSDAIHICAGGTVDACNGDSGAPLLSGDFVIGITSFGDQPCEGPAPGVFTRVAAYGDWITELTGLEPGTITAGVGCADAYATHVGSEAGEEITTGQRGDVVVALEGPDVISTGGGIDLVCAGPGDDVVALGSGFADAAFGGPGNDVLYGQGGEDRLDGGAGDDKLRGGAGEDELDGAAGADDLAGGADNDIVLGGAGDDVAVRGGTGNDLVDGGDGNDLLVAGNGGADNVFGGFGDDVLVTGGPRPDVVGGGPGNDSIKGNKGADTLHGDDGDDELRGGPQPDVIDGGAGTDLCIGGTTGDDAVEADSAENCEGVLFSFP